MPNTDVAPPDSSLGQKYPEVFPNSILGQSLRQVCANEYNVHIFLNHHKYGWVKDEHSPERVASFLEMIEEETGMYKVELTR